MTGTVRQAMFKRFIISLIILIFSNLYCYGEGYYLPAYDSASHQTQRYKNIRNIGNYSESVRKNYQDYLKTIKYDDEIKNLFLSQWEKPKHLKGHKQVTLAYMRTLEGEVSNIEILKSSGSDDFGDFDNSVIKTLQTISPLPYDVRIKKEKYIGKPYPVFLTVDYNNGNVEIFQGIYMHVYGKKLRVRSLQPEITDINRFENDMRIGAVLINKLSNIQLKEYGSTLIYVDIDDKGHFTNSYVKAPSGSVKLDNMFLNLVNSLNYEKLLPKNQNIPHAISILFESFNKDNLSEIFNPKYDKELEKYSKDAELYIKSKWHPPADVRGTASNYTSVLIEINKDGTFEKVEVFSSSGSPQFDKYAVDTVKNIGKYKPLPENFPQKSVNVLMTFVCNIYGR